MAVKDNPKYKKADEITDEGLAKLAKSPWSLPLIVLVLALFFFLGFWAAPSCAHGYEGPPPVIETAPPPAAPEAPAATASKWCGTACRVVQAGIVVITAIVAYCMFKEQDHPEFCKRDKQWESTPFPR